MTNSIHPARQLGRNLGSFGLRGLMVVKILVMIFGLFVGMDEPEALPAFAGIACILGLLLMGIAGAHTRTWVLLFGAWAPALTFVCYWLVLTNRWGPHSAREAIFGLTLFSGIVWIPILFAAWGNSSQATSVSAAVVKESLPRIRLK